MPVPSSHSQLSALVSELATLPHTFADLNSSTRNTLLVSVRETIRSRSLPPTVQALVLRTVSRLLGPSSPPENASWTALPNWDEATLTTLFALLVDALDENGFDALEKKLAKLPVTEKKHREPLSDFGKLMLTPQEQVTLDEQLSDQESDEESLLPLAVSIIPDPPEISFALQSAIETSQPAHLASAHVSHALATTGRFDRAPTVRRAAFLALATHARAMPPDLLAAFLPGLASTLARTLQNTTLEQAPVVIAALDAFAAVVFGAFPPAETRNEDDNAVTQSFTSALKKLRERTTADLDVSTALKHEGTQDSALKPDPNMPRGLLAVRNESWISAASKEISLRIRLFLESHSGPSTHSSVRARLAVVHFAALALSDTSALLLEEHTRCLLYYALAEMAGDGYPIVRNEAFCAVRRLVQDGKVGIREIERGLRALIMTVSSGKQITEVGAVNGRDEADDESTSTGNTPTRAVEEEVISRLVKAKDDQFWVRVCDGYLRIMVPLQDEESIHKRPIFPIERLPNSLVRIGLDKFCRMLVSMHEAVWVPNTDPEDELFAELENRVLTVSFQMGRTGLLPSLYTALFEYGSQSAEWETSMELSMKAGDEDELSSFGMRAHAILILQAAVRGAMAPGRIGASGGQAHCRQVLRYAKDVLGAMTSFLLPTTDDRVPNSASFVDDTMISLKRCLVHSTSDLIRDLSIAHDLELRRPFSSDITLIVLMSLLRDVSYGEPAIRKTAQLSLQAIAETTRCTNVRQLIARHLNYLISRLAKHLEEQWAGKVLSFIIGKESDEVSEEATILLETTLRDLSNSLAGASDTRALRSLSAIESVLVTAVHRVQNDVPQLESSPGSDHDVPSETSFGTLHQKLFLFCTQHVPDYMELTSNREEETTQYLNADEDEDGVKGAFEKVALNTLDGMRDLLVGRPWNVRAAALSCARWAVYLLSKNERELLPHAANILPLLPEQFVVLQQRLSKTERMLERIRQKRFGSHHDGGDVEDLVKYLNGKAAELPVVISSCHLLSALARCAGSFIRNRFVTLIYPKMRPLLRLASCYPTLLSVSTQKGYDKVTSPPSYGSMSASDACLEAIASMAAVVPETLAPHSFNIVKHLSVYFDSHQDPHSGAQRNIGHLNRSMLRYEKERWSRRVGWAEAIVRRLKTVSPGEVLTSILCHDKSAPSLVEYRDGSLNTVMVRSQQAAVR